MSLQGQLTGKKKLIRGNEIFANTFQINVKLAGYGNKIIEKLFVLEPEEEPVSEAAAEEKITLLFFPFPFLLTSYAAASQKFLLL